MVQIVNNFNFGCSVLSPLSDSSICSRVSSTESNNYQPRSSDLMFPKMQSLPYAPFLPRDYSEYGDDYQGDVPEYVAYAGNPQPFFPMVTKEEATQYLTNWHINDDYSKHLKKLLGWEDRDNKRFIFG